MSLKTPVTDDDYRSLTLADLRGYFDAIDYYERNGNTAAAQTIYSILNLIVQKSTLLSDPTTMVNGIKDYLQLNNKSITGDFTDLVKLKSTTPNRPGEGPTTTNLFLTDCANTKGGSIILSLGNIREETVDVKYSDVTNEDFSYLREPGVKRCRLVADLYYCCIADSGGDLTRPGSGRREFKSGIAYSGIVLAESILSYWYEDCGPLDDKGLATCRRPVWQSWYDMSDIGAYQEWRTLDANGNLIPMSQTIAGKDLIALIMSGMTPTGAVAANIRFGFGKEPCVAVAGNSQGGFNDVFDNSKNSYLDRLLMQSKDSSGKSFKLYESVSIYSGQPGQIQRLSKTGTQNNPEFDYISNTDDDSGARRIANAYPSGCRGKGECICGGEDINECVEVEQPTVERRQKVSSNGELIYTDEYVTENLYTIVPDQPCYEGRIRRRLRYIATERKIIVTKTCPGKDPVRYEKWVDDNMTPTSAEAGVIEIDFIDVRPAFDSTGKPLFPGCIGKEECDDEEPYVDPSDPCGCFEIHASKCYIKYPDYKTPGGFRLPGLRILSKDNFSGLGPGIKVKRRNKSAHCIDNPVRVYNGLIDTKDVLTGRDTKVIRGLFNDKQSLTCYATSSLQSTSSKEYYYQITDCEECDRINYFGVAYGHVNGSGSKMSGYESNDSPTRAIYSQASLITLDPPQTKFGFFENAVETLSDQVYIINFNRDAIVNKLDPGNFEIGLSELNGGAYANNLFTGSNVQISSSNKVLTFIDNSNDLTEEISCTNEYGDVYYYLISGSLADGAHSTGIGTEETNATFKTYGIVYPNSGLIILDARKLNEELSFNSVTGSNIAGDNAFKLYKSIVGAADLNYPMKARNINNKTTNHYFIRVSANMANYSNNPTFVLANPTNQTTGIIRNECFKTEPVTYITTIGLYNNSRELLAIAKLSRPLMKTPNVDLLIKIRLHW